MFWMMALWIFYWYANSTFSNSSSILCVVIFFLLLCLANFACHWMAYFPRKPFNNIYRTNGNKQQWKKAIKCEHRVVIYNVHKNWQNIIIYLLFWDPSSSSSSFSFLFLFERLFVLQKSVSSSIVHTYNTMQCVCEINVYWNHKAHFNVLAF